jgi:hypothetical protein
MTIELDKQIVEAAYGLYELMHEHNKNLQELNTVEIQERVESDEDKVEVDEKGKPKPKALEMPEDDELPALVHDRDSWIEHRKRLSSESQNLMLKMESLVKLLTQSHTNAHALKQEFENIRTFKYLSGETFLLGAVLPLKAKRK